MQDVIEIKEIEKLEDFQQCVEIQKMVWGFDDPFDIAPLPLLVVSKRIDGIILGAYKNNELIGFVYSLPGTHEGRKLQWSHMLAVLDPYRNLQVGQKLKMAQYEHAQKKGFELIEWTYDPLESKNAYFNLRRLGCIAKEYEENIYGITSSPLHGGMPTDRLIARWDIPAIQKDFPFDVIPQPKEIITQTTESGSILQIDNVDLTLSGEYLFLEIPGQIQKLKAESPEDALQWRLKTRDAFVNYLDKGYIVYSFIRSQTNRSYYVLKLES